MTLTPATITRLEKSATDNGFDLPLSREGDWLRFASSQTLLRVWLSVASNGQFVAAFSQKHVAQLLKEFGSLAGLLPPGSLAGLVVEDIPSLHRLMRRAFQVSKVLPEEPQRLFAKQIQHLPNSTEAERLVVQRVGQDIFRESLFQFWEGRCAITGLAVPELLRASHIKPWADCENDEERLDVFNGFLLAPHFDAVFDRGFITLSGGGDVIVSSSLTEESRRILGLDTAFRVAGIREEHQPYLTWHREKLFKDKML